MEVGELSLFWVDEKRNIIKTYSDLLNDLNSKDKYNRYIYRENPYHIYLNLIHSHVLGKNVILLDSDFSKMEIEELNIDYVDIFGRRPCKDIKISKFKELIDKIRITNWKLTLFTSGTTGKPKKIIHTPRSLTRNVKTGSKYSENIWSLAYNPTHFAALQVFYQAFFNKNPIVYIFDYCSKEIEKTFEKHSITHISATPTFYRTKILSIDHKYNSVQRITSGGERFDSEVEQYLKKIFPHAKLRNIYASTEAGSLFTSNDATFKISEKHKDYIRISKTGELLIHSQLLGIFEDDRENSEWYHTGDLVEKIEKDKFIFVSRKNEMINVGGYKVNPYEVEKEILKIEGIKNVLVTKKRNRLTGNIVVAYIVKNKARSKEQLKIEINKKLSKSLQKWKIPRIIYFVKKLETTRTGKKVRK